MSVQWGTNELTLAADLYFGGATQNDAIRLVREKFPELPHFTKEWLRFKLMRMFPERFAAYVEERKAAIKERNANILAGLRDNKSIESLCESLGVDKRTVLRLSPRAVEAGHTTKWEMPAEDKMPLDYALEGEQTVAGKSFDELASTECRFSIGKDESGGYRFCAATADEGKSYCPDHCSTCRGTQIDRFTMYRTAKNGPQLLEKAYVRAGFDHAPKNSFWGDQLGIRPRGGQVSRVSLSA